VDIKNSFVSGGVGMFAAIVVLWTMDVNLVGWLGAWVAPEYAWLVGFLITALLAVGFGAGWSAVSTKPTFKKMPVLGAGGLYGVIVGLVMIFAVPFILAAIGGDRPMGVDKAGFGITSFLGIHVTPAFPDFGVEPPLESVFDFDWYAKDDYGGRALTFGPAFIVFGLVISFFGKGK
jgi:hypothetical protein